MSASRLSAIVTVAIVVAGPSAAGAQEPSASAVMAPARQGLEPITFPRTDSLEAVVVEQLGEARDAFARAAKPGSSRSDLAAAYTSLGRVFHAYELFDGAETAYRNAVRLAPDDAESAHLLGYLYQQTGRLDEAADRLLAALRVRPDDRAAAVRLGDVFLALDRLREAREQYQSVIEVFPAAARNGLGEVALRERRYKEAIDYFRAALDRVPSATGLHYSLAMAYRGLGRLDEARSHLAQRGSGAIRAVDPIVDSLQGLVRSERLLVIQGRRFYDAGQFQEAADAFRRALAAAPQSVAARGNLGIALQQLGDDAGALAHLQAAFEQDPRDANISAALLDALVRLKREDDAIEVQKRVAAGSVEERATVDLALLLARRERYGEAVALLEEAHAKFPDRTSTASMLARLLSSSPDLSLRNGQRALEIAMAIYETSTTPADAETIALALAELGRCDQAMDWMQRAVADAERAGNAPEAMRLTGELPLYQAARCRPPQR